MPSSQCRWGILGTANIARKNWQAIRNSGNATLTAVASRTPSKAAAYIAERQADLPFAVAPAALTYEELIGSSDVDAVYIPLPTGLRKQWVLQAAEAGKHVLCEKPCALSLADLREMTDACRANGVQFMDGVMFMHSQRLSLLRSVIDSPENIGAIRRLSSHFSFMAPEEFLSNNIRMNSELEPFGSLGDLGWYSLRMALWTLNWELPVQVSARSLLQQGRADSPQHVPLELTAELRFKNDVSLGLFCSFQVENQQFFTISGTKGFIHLNDFVLPYYGSDVGFQQVNDRFEISGSQFNMAHRAERHVVEEYSNNHCSSQETEMIRTFSNCVVQRQPDVHWPAIALKTQAVLDACFASAQRDGEWVVPESVG